MLLGVDGQDLFVTHRSGTSSIQVGPNTPIVLFGPGTASDLVAGAHVFVREARPGADGVLEAAAIVVGRNGAAPAL